MSKNGFRPRIRVCFVKNWFMLTTILGVVIGFGAGFGIQNIGVNSTVKMWIGMPGNIYIRLLQLTILPMIASNVIKVMADLNPKENGKISTVSLVYIFCANLISSLIGVAYSFIIKPGLQADSSDGPSIEVVEHPDQISYIFKDLLLNIFPDNIIGVTIFQAGTNFDNDTGKIYDPVVLSGTNMIGVLFCSIVFGIAANTAHEKGTAFKTFFVSLSDVVMLLMQKFLLITPIGVCFMVMSSIAGITHIGNTFASLGFFVLLNFVGLVTHLIFLLLSVLFLGRNPLGILKLSAPAWFIAFATSSGFVSLPKAFDACDTYGMPQSVSRFVLPLAATMKSDASAIFISASCIFVAQLNDVNLDAAKIVIIIILSATYVTALPKIPSASVVCVVTILSSIGVNTEQTSLLFAVEWINDRMRSGNVALSHLYCATFTYHFCQKNSSKQDVLEEKESESSTLHSKEIA